MNSGADTEQKVNGKIAYIPVGGKIIIADTEDHTNG